MGNTSSITELANAEKGSGAKLREEVGPAGRDGKVGEEEESSVGGLDGTTVR